MKKNTLKIVLAIALSGFALSANATAYTFTDLGTLGGVSSWATAINASGQVVGSSWTVDKMVHATLWNGTSTTDLGLMSGADSVANDINDAGQVVGSSSAFGATLWNGTVATGLRKVGSNNFLEANITNATGINNAGQIVGSGSVFVPGNGYNTQYSFQEQALLLDGTTITNLGTFGGLTSRATAINNTAQVVGYADITVGDTRLSGRRAALWNGTTISNPGGDWQETSRAFDINDTGQVAGYSVFAGGELHATIWNGDTATDLGTLVGAERSYAAAINISGQVAGVSLFTGIGSRATLWNGTEATDLNSFLNASTVAAGWVLTEATGINANGWIIGNATNGLTGVQHAFVLAAVPEPESYSILLMGLGLMGFFVRRHKNQQS